MNTSFFTLPEIAVWFYGGASSGGSAAVEIPAFQRGLVWNAAQIEVLWDSLLRDIPIGAFSLLPMRGNERYSKASSAVAEPAAPEHYFLLDGQQRASAIAMGYKAFPATGDGGEASPILWIDLLPSEEERGRSNRRFFFRVTTPARPWGYRIEDANGENSAGKVPVPKYLEALGEIGWAAESSEKPAPSRLWPVCARLPVPVSVLRGLPDSSLSRAGLVAAGGGAPWARHLATAADALGAEDARRLDEAIADLRGRLRRASETRIMAMVAPEGLADTPPEAARDGDNSEIALYFSRLNRGGTTPSREDLDYSILKSILPELHAIDDCANGRMHPARLANLAMLAFLSAESAGGWKNGLSRRDIFVLRDKPDFVKYVSTELPRDIAAIDDWLLFKPGTAEYGIPEYLRTRISRQNPNLYRFLLLLAGKMRGEPAKAIGGDARFLRFLAAFCTTLVWFGNDGALDFASLARDLDGLACSSFPVSKTTIGAWMGMQAEMGALDIPPAPGYFRKIADTAAEGDRDAIVAAWSEQPDANAANRIWYWNGEGGRGIVLYACRRYLRGKFGGYDPASAVWNEDARPWDYDHIVPQSWIKYSYHGRCHDLVAEFLNSIGNIAPIPFGANRSKGGIPPGEVALYRDAAAKESLFIDFKVDGRIPRFANEYLILEDDEAAAIDFARVTARRMAALYSEWWDSLGIGELLDDCLVRHRRDEVETFARELRERFPDCANRIRTVFVAVDGRQHDVGRSCDWARPWLSCGIGGWFHRKDSDERIRCFLCETFQDDKREFGLRRHPDETAVAGKNEWWIDGQRLQEGDFLSYASELKESGKFISGA